MKHEGWSGLANEADRYNCCMLDWPWTLMLIWTCLIIVWVLSLSKLIINRYMVIHRVYVSVLGSCTKWSGCSLQGSYRTFLMDNLSKLIAGINIGVLWAVIMMQIMNPPTFGHHFITYRVSKEFIQPCVAFHNWLFVPGKILVLYSVFRYHPSTVKGL